MKRHNLKPETFSEIKTPIRENTIRNFLNSRSKPDERSITTSLELLRTTRNIFDQERVRNFTLQEDTRDISHLRDTPEFRAKGFQLPTDISTLALLFKSSNNRGPHVIHGHTHICSKDFCLERLASKKEPLFPQDIGERYNLGNPTGREDILNLKKWFEYMKEKHLKNKPATEIEFENAKVIYTMCMRELIRQVSVQCFERGELMRAIVDGLQMFYYEEENWYEDCIEETKKECKFDVKKAQRAKFEVIELSKNENEKMRERLKEAIEKKKEYKIEKNELQEEIEKIKIFGKMQRLERPNEMEFSGLLTPLRVSKLEKPKKVIIVKSLTDSEVEVPEDDYFLSEEKNNCEENHPHFSISEKIVEVEQEEIETISIGVQYEYEYVLAHTSTKILENLRLAQRKTDIIQDTSPTEETERLDPEFSSEIKLKVLPDERKKIEEQDTETMYQIKKNQDKLKVNIEKLEENNKFQPEIYKIENQTSSERFLSDIISQDLSEINVLPEKSLLYTDRPQNESYEKVSIDIDEVLLQSIEEEFTYQEEPPFEEERKIPEFKMKKPASVSMLEQSHESESVEDYTIPKTNQSIEKEEEKDSLNEKINTKVEDKSIEAEYEKSEESSDWSVEEPYQNLENEMLLYPKHSISSPLQKKFEMKIQSIGEISITPNFQSKNNISNLVESQNESEESSPLKHQLQESQESVYTPIPLKRKLNSNTSNLSSISLSNFPAIENKAEPNEKTSESFSAEQVERLDDSKLIEYIPKGSDISSWNSGFHVGLEKGITMGYSEGHIIGKEIGYEEGYTIAIKHFSTKEIQDEEFSEEKKEYKTIEETIKRSRSSDISSILSSPIKRKKFPTITVNDSDQSSKFNELDPEISFEQKPNQDFITKLTISGKSISESSNTDFLNSPPEMSSVKRIKKKTTEVIEFNWNKANSSFKQQRKGVFLFLDILQKPLQQILTKSQLSNRVLNKTIAQIYHLASSKQNLQDPLDLVDLIHEDFIQRYGLKSVADRKFAELFGSAFKFRNTKQTTFLRLIGASKKLNLEPYSKEALEFYLKLYEFMIHSTLGVTIHVDESADSVLLPTVRATECLQEVGKVFNFDQKNRLHRWIIIKSQPDPKRINTAGLIDSDKFMEEMLLAFEEHRKSIEEGVRRCWKALMEKTQFLLVDEIEHLIFKIHPKHSLVLEDSVFTLESLTALCLNENLLSDLVVSEVAEKVEEVDVDGLLYRLEVMPEMEPERFYFNDELVSRLKSLQEESMEEIDVKLAWMLLTSID